MSLVNVASAYKWKFLSLWAGSMVVLGCIGFATDIDWAKPEFEEMLSRNLSRKVLLGHLAWNFSFNGLAVSTRTLKVLDLDGRSPFLNAAHSEIGVAFKPLLHHKVVLQHIVMRKPELWAIRLSPGRWNYSDIMDSIVEARFINAYNATIHVRDHASRSTLQPGPALTAIPDYDFEHVELRFVNPRPRHAWPFFLSGELPRHSYASTLKISALGNGNWQDWKASHYKFEVKAKKLNPADLAPLMGYSLPVSGTFDLDARGSGSYDKGFSGTAYSTISNFQLPGSKIMHLPPINTQLTTKFNVSGGMMHLDSGTTRLLLGFSGNSQKPAYVGSISAKQVALNQLMSLLPPNWRPSTPRNSVSSSSTVEGKMEIKPDRTIVISGLTMSSGKSKIVADGSWSAVKPQYGFRLTGQNVELGSLNGGALKASPGASKQGPSLGLSKGRAGAVKLRGNVNFTASIEGSRNHDGHALTSFDAVFLNDAIISKDFELKDLSGSVKYNGRSLTLNNLIGAADGDTLTLNGTVNYGTKPSCLLNLTANKIDLKHLTAIFRLLNIDVPILEKQIVYGTVRALNLKIVGSDVQVSFIPDLMYYRPVHASYPLQVTGGQVIYRNNSIELKLVDLSLKQTQLKASGLITGLNKHPTLAHCRFKAQGADLAEVSSLLGGPFIPYSVKQEFQPYLSLIDLPSLHGKLNVNMSWQRSHLNSGERRRGDMRGEPERYSVPAEEARDEADGAVTKKDNYILGGAVGFSGVSGQLNCCNGLTFSNLYGAMRVSGTQLTLQNLVGLIGSSPFRINGSIADYQSPSANWQLEGESHLRLADALQFVPDASPALKAAGAFHLRTHLAGDRNNSTIIFSCHTGQSDHLSLSIPPVTIVSPQKEPMRLDGSLLLSNANDSGNMELKNCYLTIGKSVLCSVGDYGWSNTDNNTSGTGEDPTLKVRVWSSEPLPAQTLFEILGWGLKQNSTSGIFYGSLECGGPISNLESKAFLGFSDLTVPQYDLKKATGTIDAPRWIVRNLGSNSKKLVFGAPGSSATLKLSQMEGEKLRLQNISAQLIAQDKEGHVQIALRNGNGSIFGGTVHFAGWLDKTDDVPRKIHLGLDAADIDAAMVAAVLFNHPNEITGTAALTAVVATQGASTRDMVENLSGQGAFRINHGMVYRFGSFQERLSEFNLLRQGVFGFNLNNLLQTMVPVRNGTFNDLSGAFNIEKGIVSFKELRYDANDMRLWGVGTANLPLDTIDMQIAGKIPRVLPSVLGGPMGKFSRSITLQNLLDIVTMHKLESLPSLPVLGDIANDRPRTFSFQILSPLNQPHSISQSIEKTFAWLPSMPNASAHPVPALSVP